MSMYASESYRRCLEEEKQEKDAKRQVSDLKDYTIFHAVVETKEKKKGNLDVAGFYSNHDCVNNFAYYVNLNMAVF